MALNLKHIAWLKHGRQYQVLDDQDHLIQDRFAYQTHVGQKNVDVNDDGSEFAPYVMNDVAGSLRFGDSQCDFADGWQTIKHLGQTIVNRSRIYIQRDIGGVWIDIPHGIPTRNVRVDYPREDRATAYLDFPNIQGYANGSRLQVGIEVGGGDRQILGFRLRSPVAGTFRLEWVLEVSGDVPLSYIKAPKIFDPDETILGGQIGNVRIRWAREEAPNRSVTVESSEGNKLVHIFLGPYNLNAMEWLNIYPDTFGPASAVDDCLEVEGIAYYDDNGSGDVAVGDYAATYKFHAGLLFTNVTVPAGATANDGCALTLYSNVSPGYNGSGAIAAALRMVDSSSPAAWGAANLPSGQSLHAASVTWQGVIATYTSINSPEIKTLIQARIDGGHTSGDGMAIVWLTSHTPSGDHNVYFDAEEAGTAAQLTIDYTVAGGGFQPAWARNSNVILQAGHL